MKKGLVTRRLSKRAFGLALLHLAIFAAVYCVAYVLRFGRLQFPREPVDYFYLFWVSLPAVLLTKLSIFYYLGHCHVSWRYVTFSDLAAIIRSSTLAALILFAMQHLMFSLRMMEITIPNIVMFLDWLMTIVALGGVRSWSRLKHEEIRPFLTRSEAKKALIIGANRAGEALVRHLQTDEEAKYEVIGFLDKDESRHGSSLAQIPVISGPEQTLNVAGDLGAEVVMVTSEALTGDELRVLIDHCQHAELSIKLIPALEEFLQGDYRRQIRDVDIHDLLRRAPVELDNTEISTLLRGNAVLVTGAGGSIGSEICRQVLKFEPASLVLLEQAENALFFIDQELNRLGSVTKIVPVVADITDAARIESIFRERRPHVVFHAAAHKHVPMMELNPGEAIKNNVLGTKQLAELANQYRVDEFVMISTDKAVNPTSVMGVSKQLAERFVHAFSEAASTKFVVVRFGNVLASNGSVVPIFQEQIRRGGPVTVTHPEIQRYFMTIPEASQLVLQAATMGNGGEIFVLDMGDPVRIVDLAHDLIRLSGLNSDEIEIVFTGLRPGEKLYEELYFDDEEMLPTPHPKVFVAYHRPYKLAEVRKTIGELAGLAHGSVEALRSRLKELVPEYQPDPAIARAVAVEPDLASEDAPESENAPVAKTA